MSEAITKACNAYRCDGGICKYTEMPWVTCSKCKGTGRLPDIEATRRAQLNAQRILIERFDAALRGKESENAELRGEVGRLTEELAAERDHSRRAARRRQLQGAATKRVRARARARSQTTAKIARLTAEVERLASRLKSAEEVVVQARQLGAYSWEDRLDDSRVSDDAKQDARELEIAVWHYDQLTARLAGCKS